MWLSLTRSLILIGLLEGQACLPGLSSAGSAGWNRIHTHSHAHTTHIQSHARSQSHSDTLTGPGTHATHMDSQMSLYTVSHPKHLLKYNLGYGSLRPLPGTCTWPTVFHSSWSHCPLSVTFHSPCVTRQLRWPGVGLLEGGWGPEACSSLVWVTGGRNIACLGRPANPSRLPQVSQESVFRS